MRIFAIFFIFIFRFDIYFYFLLFIGISDGMNTDKIRTHKDRL